MTTKPMRLPRRAASKPAAVGTTAVGTTASSTPTAPGRILPWYEIALALAFGITLFWAGFRPIPWLSVAAIVVPLLEIWISPAGSLRARVAARWPAIVMALSVLTIIVLVPRLATQVGAAGLYVVWRILEAQSRATTAAQAHERPSAGLLGLLAVQAAMLEAIFLYAATKPVSPGVVLTLLYGGSFSLIYLWLRTRGERSAGILAAVWALVASECGWVLLTWLVVYVTAGGYVVVPQPTLVLTGLAYVFGGIYASGRENRLTRGRLGEYLFIGLLMIAIIVVGTRWQGTL